MTQDDNESIESVSSHSQFMILCVLSGGDLSRTYQIKHSWKFNPIKEQKESGYEHSYWEVRVQTKRGDDDCGSGQSFLS